MYENKQEIKISVEKNIAKDILEQIDELIFIIELDKAFAPKCFVDFNINTLSCLEYSNIELTKMPPLDILSFYKYKRGEDFYRNLSYKKYDKVKGTLKSKSGKFIDIEAKMFFFNQNKKNYILVVASDMFDCSHLIKELNGILNGIPDVIKVFKTDHTIICMNDAGYSFYNKNPQEVIGKRCIDFKINGEKCIDCSFEKVIETKQMITNEKYITELNKFMDVCYNPVLDDNEEVLFVVERLRDITEKKIIDTVLKESKDRYKQIVNRFPYPTVIVVDNKIVLANNEAVNLIGINSSELVGSNVYKYFDEKYAKALHKKFKNVIAQKKEKEIDEAEFCFSDGKIRYLEMSYSYTLYAGIPGIIVVIRDITHVKQELKKAAEFQRNNLQKSFPAERFVNIETLYLPAKTVSGDFYRICKVNEDFIIGIVIDVRGKGISAALNISAFDILFLQEVAITHEPINIVKNLNKKLIDFYEENYIAVCCFGIDFNKGQLNVVGAGLNQFIMQRKDREAEQKIIEGSFLGMFEDSEFSEKIFKIESGDKVFFFTDGLDFILNEDRIIKKHMEKWSIFQSKEYIEIVLYNSIIENGTLKDDCTMIAMEII